MKAIIIDDEHRARISLQLLLKEYCAEIEIVAECENLPEGVKAIRKHRPDVILLDIEMPGHSGLELLDFFDEKEVDFSIIFTTAYNEYAIQAFKFSAIDYLLKPIHPEQLKNAIDRVARQKQKFENFRALKENMHQENLTKIAVPCGNKLIFLEIANILYIKAEGAYSEVHCTNGTKNLISRNLKNFEDILCADNGFVRTHRSYIVNLKKVLAYNKSDGGSLELEMGVEIPVSVERIPFLLEQIHLVRR